MKVLSLSLHTQASSFSWSLKAVRKTFLKEEEYVKDLYHGVVAGYVGHTKKWKSYCVVGWWQHRSPAEHQEEVVGRLLKGSLAPVCL